VNQKLSATVRDHSGVLVRVLSTLDGFHAKHGTWPTTLRLYDAGISALVTKHLTPRGFFQLHSKVLLEEGPMGDVIAMSSDGRSFSYSTDSGSGAPQLAHEWLGLELPADNDV